MELLLQEELPSNPFPALANKLSTHVDRGRLWGMDDIQVITLMASTGELEVVDDPTKLSKLRGSPYVWGLPHVLFGLDARDLPGQLLRIPLRSNGRSTALLKGNGLEEPNPGRKNLLDPPWD